MMRIKPMAWARWRAQLESFPSAEAVTGPMPGTAANRLAVSSAHTPRKLGEKADKPAGCERAGHHDLAVRIDGVNLKDLLRQIEPTCVTELTF
jgi:hypothetical protein